MNNQRESQIIREFFKKCIEGNTGDHPGRSAEVENIEKSLEHLSKQIQNLENEIRSHKSILASFNFYIYVFDIFQGIFEKGSSIRKCLGFIVNQPMVLLLPLLLLWIGSHLLNQLLFSSLILFVFIILVVLVRADYEGKYKQLEESVNLKENQRRDLINQIKNLQQNKSTKEQEYINYFKNEKESMMSLEKQVHQLLEEDKKNLIREAAKILKFRLPPSLSEEIESEDCLESMEHNPIVFCIGDANPFASRKKGIFGKNSIISEEISDLDREYGDILIEPEFRIPSEGLRNPFARKYGYYEFYKIEIILLGSNSLIYHSCLWNFLKRDYVDLKTGEYFYDAITSIETRERSSLRQKSSPKRRIYSEILSISTYDGKVLRIKHRKDRTYTEKSKSEIYQAAEEIRQWLRSHRK